MDMLSSLFCLFHVLTPIFIEKISPNPGLRLVLQCAAAAARPAVRAHRALRRGARWGRRGAHGHGEAGDGDGGDDQAASDFDGGAGAGGMWVGHEIGGGK
jgi:hypothetical protein